MKYENAADILPEDLLKRVQKFAAGRLIYVPETIGKRSWVGNNIQKNATVQLRFFIK